MLEHKRYSLSVDKLPWWQEQSQRFPQLCQILTSYTGSSQTQVCADNDVWLALVMQYLS